MPGRHEKRVGQAWEPRVPPAAHSPRTHSSDMAEARTSLRRTSAPGRSLFSLSRCRAASGCPPPGSGRYSWCPSPAAFPAPSEPPGSSRSDGAEERAQAPPANWGLGAAPRRHSCEAGAARAPSRHSGWDPCESLGGAKPQGHAPGQSAGAQSADPAPQEHVDNEVPFIFLICEIDSSSAH